MRNSTIVRKLEGRWDLIESCLATLDEANSIAVSATVETEGVVKP